MSVMKWLQRRELGLPKNIGVGNCMYHRMYHALEQRTQLNCSKDQMGETGAIFNLEFSPLGNVLVAACERKAILLYDVLSTRLIYNVNNAHRDSVNCIKFLDNHLFATCSDDATIALWDLRYLKMKLRRLHGHTNWVKNIEYSSKDNLLVTSGFDGSIFTWDINALTEEGLIHQKVFHTSGLMRCRISPDDSKLIICSTGGYMMIVHKLDLSYLQRDLCGFRPGMYRLMQSGQQYLPQAAKHDYIFSKNQSRNRVELVTDFPPGNDAEVILTLQIHPYCQAVLSRNISFDERTEWTCIHDLHEVFDDDDDDDKDSEKQGEDGNLNKCVPLKTSKPHRKRKLCSSSQTTGECNLRSSTIASNSNANSNNSSNTSDSTNSFDASNNNNSYSRSESIRRLLSLNVRTHGRSRSRMYPRASFGQHFAGTQFVPLTSRTSNSAVASADNGSTNRPETVLLDIWEAEITLRDRAARQDRALTTRSMSSYNYVYAFNSGVLPNAQATTTTANPIDSDEDSDSEEIESTNDKDSHKVVAKEHKIHQNAKKLIYYAKEANCGRGYIKEPSFSADGRIICSPYIGGVRLLAFNNNCSECPTNESVIRECKTNPRQLHVIKQLGEEGGSLILSTKFSPREPLLVTGSKEGEIKWHYPQL